MKYAYPAIIRQEDGGLYSVEFPDMEEEGEAIPAPSNLKDVSADADALVSLVCCDTIEYRKLYNNKAVKKTLTIPAWLNTMAERADLNFSDVLREALKLRLHIQ